MTLRSKSTSHILDIRTERSKKNLRESTPISTEDKYNTYTVEDFAERRKRFSSGNVTGESRKTRSNANRSQNFVKRIIASFESKNEVCAANDEFLTTYCYNQADSNSRCCFNNDRKLETCVKMKRNETETRVPPVSSEIEASEIRSEEYRGKLRDFTLLNVPVEDHEELARSNAVERRRNVVALDRDNSVRSAAVTFNGEETDFKINENDKRRRKSDYVECNWKNGGIVIRGYEAKASTFDPRRDRVELQNREHVVATSSYVFESGPNNRKANTLERITCKSELTNWKLNEKDSTRNTTKKWLKGRNRLFKCFFGSVIKWRKSEAKDRSQRFMIHDDLFDETNRPRRKSKKKSKSSPCRTMVFQENLELETNEHKATIHPIYEGRRSKRLAKKNEDRKRLMIQGNMENVVRPSAIKNIIKQLSQFS